MAKASQYLRAMSVEPRAPGEDRHPHAHGVHVTVDGGRVDHREDGLVRVGLVDGLGPPGEAEDVQMRVVDRVLLVPAGGHVAEGTRVDDLPAAEGRLEHVAVALAVGHAARADARAGHVSRAVSGLQCLVRTGVREIHARSPLLILATAQLSRSTLWMYPERAAAIRARPCRIGSPVGGPAERGGAGDEVGPAPKPAPPERRRNEGG